MIPSGGTAREAVAIQRIGIDDHSDVRHLHARAMHAQSGDALSDTEIAAFLGYVASPAYSDCLLAEEVFGAFVGGQLVGTASWQVNGDDGRTVRIGPVFVHPLFARLGIGGRLLGEVEARACRAGFDQLGTSTTINAVSFFRRHGYREAARGVIALGSGSWLPVAFLRKHVPRVSRSPQDRADTPGSLNT